MFLRLSSEQSVGDVRMAKLQDWKRVLQATSSGCKSSVVAVTAVTYVLSMVL